MPVREDAGHFEGTEIIIHIVHAQLRLVVAVLCAESLLLLVEVFWERLLRVRKMVVVLTSV